MVSEQRLREAPFEVVGRFADASNATLLVRLTDVDDGPLPDGTTFDDLDPAHLAVHKPALGEAPLWDFPDGTLHRREVAAYELDRLLGWGLVPPTVLRDGPHGVGSLQGYVPHDPQQHYFTLLEQAAEGDGELERQLQRVVLFDLVANNADRKGGHVLRSSVDGRIRLVDHGICFHAEHKLRTVAWHFAGRDVQDADAGEVAALSVRLVDDPGALPDLLLDDEFEALVRRADSVARLVSFPEPSGPRPYPWPLI